LIFKFIYSIIVNYKACPAQNNFLLFLCLGSIAISKKIMAIQEAFASCPRLPGETGGEADNGHASLINRDPTESGGPPHRLPAICSSCSASCSSTSSPPSVPHHAAPSMPPCPAREFRRSLVYCGEFGKTLIDIGQLSAKTGGVPNAAMACAAMSTIAAAGVPCCPKRTETTPTGGGEDISPADKLAKITCTTTAEYTATVASSPPQAALPPALPAAPAAHQPPVSVVSNNPPPMSNGAAGCSLAQPCVKPPNGGEKEGDGSTVRTERSGGQGRSGGRQGPRHRFIINLDDKNKFTEEVTV
jgi:hypothetical protein